MALESQVEKEIQLYIHSTGGNFHKLNAQYQPGIPDRIATWPPGHCIYFEIKQPGGRISAIQKQRIKKLKENGYSVHVVYSVDDVKSIVEPLEFTKLPKKLAIKRTGYQLNY